MQLSPMPYLIYRWLLKRFSQALESSLEKEGALGLLSLVVAVIGVVFAYVYYRVRFFY